MDWSTKLALFAAGAFIVAAACGGFAAGNWHIGVDALLAGVYGTFVILRLKAAVSKG